MSLSEKIELIYNIQDLLDRQLSDATKLKIYEYFEIDVKSKLKDKDYSINYNYDLGILHLTLQTELLTNEQLYQIYGILINDTTFSSENN